MTTIYFNGEFWGTGNKNETMKTLRKQGYKVTITPQAGAVSFRLDAVSK